MKKIIAIITILIFSQSAFAKPMSMIDLLNIPLVNDAQLSPNSEQILFVIRKADWIKNKNKASINCKLYIRFCYWSHTIRQSRY